jgi:hypothetical protein
LVKKSELLESALLCMERQGEIMSAAIVCPVVWTFGAGVSTGQFESENIRLIHPYSCERYIYFPGVYNLIQQLVIGGSFLLVNLVHYSETYRFLRSYPSSVYLRYIWKQ